MVQIVRIEDVKDDTRFRIGDISNVAQYDKENGTELGAWLDFVENGTIAPNKRQFFLGMTGDVLSRYGIKGKINVSRKAINLNRHSNDEDHKLGVQEWIDIIDTINEPVAITKYKDKSNSYRIYTFAKINGKNICVGVDVDTNNVVEITKIVTAFERDVAKIKTATNEELVYEKEKAEEKISGSDNPHRYSQQPSTDKDTKNIPNTQEGATRSKKNGGQC